MTKNNYSGLNLPTEILKSENMQLCIDNLRRNGISDETINRWYLELKNDHRNKYKNRNRYLSGWYDDNECQAYWKAIGNKDWNKLKSLHKEHVDGIDCPACRILKLRDIL